MTIDCPTLETDRLILTRHDKDDFSDRVKLWQAPEIFKFFGGQPKSEEEIWTRLLFFIGHWEISHYGYWAVRHKETGDFIGEVGFMDGKRNLNISCETEPETGWIISPNYQRQGIASEALESVHTWLKDTQPSARPFCIIDPENINSIKLARKFDYKFIGESEYKANSIHIFQKN